MKKTMTTVPNDNAIPSPTMSGQHGLTKREWFAGLAMQGLLAADYDDSMVTAKGVVSVSVAIADKLIAELNKEKA
jgi:hypothetical protein